MVSLCYHWRKCGGGLHRKHVAKTAILVVVFIACGTNGALADADDTLCQAIASANGGPVNWPDEEPFVGGTGAENIFDNVWVSPWWFSQSARNYISGYFAGGHNWHDKGDVMSFNPVTYEVDTPIGRTYNGYANIVYADIDVYDAPFGPKLNRTRSLNDFDYYDTFLKWASAFVYQQTFRVDGNCPAVCGDPTDPNDGCTIAITHNGVFRSRDYIELFQSFYYHIDAVWRGSSIVHEVRHARNGPGHSGGCPRGSSCDPYWSYRGANTYEMMWLAAYYHTPHNHPYITDLRRDRAEALFESLRTGAFGQPVNWILGNFLFINLIPDYYINWVACSESPNLIHSCLICC